MMINIKLCYEELEKHDFRIVKSNLHPNGRLALYKGVPNYKTGIPSTKYFDIYGYYEECKCDWCNEVFLTKSNSKQKLCSKECSTKLTKWNKQQNSYTKQQLYRFKKTAIKLKQKQKKKQTARYFELIEKAKIYPLYERNLVLKSYYNIKQSIDDKDYLEVQCAYCNKWFKPSYNQIRGIKNFVNGNNCKKYSTNFYCCGKHRQALKKELNKIKITWKALKTPIEVFILPEIIVKQKIFKTSSTKKNKYFKSIITQLKNKERKIAKQLKKELRKLNFKMPKDKEGRRLYVLEQAKNRNEKLRIEDPKEFKLRRLFTYSKARAKEKRINHTITRNWLDEKLKNNICELTQLPFDYDTTIQRNPFGPSIDRIDITKGYIPENCRLVLWAVNAGLGHYTEKDLYIICKAYLEFNNKIISDN